MQISRYLKPRLNCIIATSICLVLMLLSAGCDQGHAIDNEGLQDLQATPAQLPMITFAISATGTPLPTFTSAPTKTPVFLPTIYASGPISIGRSIEGRRILVYRFGNGSSERLLVGGIHGGSEWNTTSLLHLVIEKLYDQSELVPDDVTLYILPCLNPDGAAKGEVSQGRVNANNVDLNRNWEAEWLPEWPRKGCWNQMPTTAGEFAMSEPETKALESFIKAHHFDAIISYHSAALGIFPGGLPPTSASKSLAEAVAAVSPYPYPPIDTGCLYTGMFVDWAAIQGIAALDVELQNHFDEDLEINLKVLEAFLSWFPGE